MDKSWIVSRDRNSKAYIDGVEAFIDFAYTDKNRQLSNIKCPCHRCVNRFYHNLQTVKIHINMHGFETSYTDWIYHGELYRDLNNINDNVRDDIVVDDISIETNSVASMTAMVHEGRGIPLLEDNFGNDEPRIEDVAGSNENLPKYFKLLEEAENELYENCPRGITELSFIVELLHLKQLNGWTNRSFTMLLVLLKKVFPNVKIPKSFYQANKLTSDLGFNYDTWDACPNSCMLFRNEVENLDKCDICGASRYKPNAVTEVDHGEQGKKVAAKSVRYFPLKPRLQRLFWSSHTAPLMKWHVDERIDDGVMRHPADSRAWKLFDERNPNFASDSRNVRLGLATDGFNPFGNLSIAHSTWPVVLIPYNLPPWLCMKQPHLILSILIDGPKGPGDKIDVFLQPLVDELKELWSEGVSTYDASTKQFFQLHAALLWTISDFPAYAMLSGWSTKGEFACPYCNRDHQATRLKHGGKYCYWGHRRFLTPRHRFRKEKSSFNGKVDLKPPPLKLSGSQVLQQLNDLDIETEYKKEDVLRKRSREQMEKEYARLTKGKVLKNRLNWKKKSIFFELPYWEHNLIRHNLDVMHIEKNVCDNVLFTLLGIKGKTKDNLKARKDLEEMNIRCDLHPQPRGANLEYIAPAEFMMSNKEKEIFLKVLRDIRVPDGYSSNISRCVHLQERSIWGLKSHDNHIIMQQLLPIAIRRVLPKYVVKALIELSNCFAILCSSVNTPSDLEKFEDRMALTLCSLEKIFPPGFFDVMEHLPIHLADELLFAGAVFYRWMYPVERYLHTLKLFVRNRAHPEASIAKSILIDECMTFCSRYLDDNVETKSNRPIRNDDRGNYCGRAVGKKTQFHLDLVTYTQVHRYVLANTDSVKPFIEKHLAELSIKYPHVSQQHLVRRLHNEHFHTWFRDHVNELAKDVQLSSEIRNLALGPVKDALSFNAYVVRGFRFRIKKVDMRRKTQNSGVVLKATQMSYASRRDTNPISGDITFYGELTDIIEIQYLNGMKFVLFKCNWVDNRVGRKVDEFNFTLVNFNHLLYKDNRAVDEPFILALQAEQVWYAHDPLELDWHVVVRMTLRDRFDRYSTAEEELEVPRVESFSRQELDQAQHVSWVRQGVDGSIIDTTVPDTDEIVDEMDE